MRPPDRLFSKFIRQRDGHCLNCGSSRGLQCAHIISRRYASTRCNPDNAVTLCLECHTHYTGNPKEWDEWVDDRWPGRRRALLDSVHLVALTKPDWKTIAAWLRKETT